MSAKETIKEVLEGHNLVRVATIDESGKPAVRSMDFAKGDEENVLYCITRRDSRKVRHFRKSPVVGIVVDHDCPSAEKLAQLKYVKGTGTVELIEDPAGTGKAFGLLAEKLPFLKDLPGDPSDFVGVKLTLGEVLVTDNTISFGHTETVTY